MVTIYDISKETGYSPMTVSRALSSQKIVKQETRDKILEAARKMGYIPNLTAKNLKTQKSYEIGLLFHIGDTFGFREPFVVEILENFMTVVAEKGYSLSIINADALHNQSLLNYSFSKSFDGVFVLCGDFTNSAVVELVESNLPVVAVDFMESDLTTINFVSTDNRQMMFELTNYIISMGHTNIVYLTGQKCYVTYERKKGFLKIYGNRVNLDEIDRLIKGKFDSIDCASAGTDDHMYIFVTDT